MIKSSNIKSKKEKNKMQGLKTKVYSKAFCFAGQDAIECVIRFRIDNCTIKRGVLKLHGHLVPLSVIYIAYA